MVKSHSRGPLAPRRTVFVPTVVLARRSDVPLHRQIATQMSQAIRGRSTGPARLPSSRTLARLLGVSRNTILVAYDELAAEGLIHGRHGAGMQIVPASGAAVPAFDMVRLLRAAHYPARTAWATDCDGNPLYLTF